MSRFERDERANKADERPLLPAQSALAYVLGPGWKEFHNWLVSNEGPAASEEIDRAEMERAFSILIKITDHVGISQ